MRHLRPIQRALAAVALPLLLLASVGTDWTLYRCRFHGSLQLSPCCAHESDEDQSANVESPDDDACCTAVTIPTVHASFVQHSADESVAALAPNVTPLARVESRPRAGWSAAESIVATGPPVLLKTCSLLI